MKYITKRLERLEETVGKGSPATLEMIVAASWEAGDASYDPEAERRLAACEPSPVLLLLAGCGDNVP